MFLRGLRKYSVCCTFLTRHCVLCVHFRYFLDVCAKQLETRDSFQLLYIHVQLRVGSLTSPSYQLFGLFWYVL